LTGRIEVEMSDFNRMSPGGLKHQMIRASRWSMLAELSTKAFMPLLFICLAQILTPDDFGVVSASAILISFSQVLWDAGFTKALVQRTNDIERAAHVVFWTNVGLALIVYFVLYATADLAAVLFKDARVCNVLRIQGLQLMPAAATAVFSALYQRQLDFRILFWSRLLTTILPGIVSLPFAY
jgi:O-antigen/teichoic acid export membrane protein